MQDGLETPLDGGLYFNIDFDAEKLFVYGPVFFKTINCVNKSFSPDGMFGADGRCVVTWHNLG